MQIVGKFYAEDTIYRAAYAWEQAFDWKTYAESEGEMTA
jgi:amidase